MHINGDLYYDTSDIESVVQDLKKVKVNASLKDAEILDSAIDILCDVIDAAE